MNDDTPFHRATDEDGQPNEFDRSMGHPQPCQHCGFAWSVHRCNDQLCPGLDQAGRLWRGSWHISKGTTYAPAEQPE